MITIQITAKRRRPVLLWRRRFLFQLPETWNELGNKRAAWWRALLSATDAEEVKRKFVFSYIPRRWRKLLDVEDLGAMVATLGWFQAATDCTIIPLPEYTVRGTRYILAKPNGENVSCAEFAVCDDLYKLAAQKADIVSLNQLTATVFREENTDQKQAAKLGDVRVPFFSIEESKCRIAEMGEVPQEMQAQALLYFSGLKAWVHRVYGKWIFEEPDEDENGNPIPVQSNGPDFGWWGILQTVAESGVFGTLEQVYQANLHEVCIFLVRKRQEADRMEQSMQQSNRNDDLH